METLFLALRVLVALGAILALIWFVQRKVTGKQSGARTSVAGRFGAARAGMPRKAIAVLGTHRLGAKASISVVEIDGVRMVLGVTEHGISVLENAPQPLVVAPASVAPVAEAPAPEVAAPEPVDFAAVLREALGEAADVAPVASVVEAPQTERAAPRRRRAIPALAEQLLPQMTRTLAAGIGIRMDPAPGAPASPRPAPTSGGALAAFLANSAPATAEAEPIAAPVKDYSAAQPLATHLRVLQRAS